VRFDDRLLTVLNQPAEDRHDTAVRWRQLVDLVARAGANSASPVISEALEAIRTEAPRVDEPLRAAAARAVAALPLPLGLFEYFASDTLTVSAPVLAAATLDASQWRSLHDATDEETRSFIETLHPEVAIEQRIQGPTPVAPTPSAAPPPEPEQVRAAPYAPPSLHDVVERIERRRHLRSGTPAPAAEAAVHAHPIGSPALFRWECGPGGEIAWVEGAPRGALIGRSIARPVESDGDRVDQDVVRAFAVRAPFRDALLTVAGGGPVSGEWKISGVPAFEPADGRFAGYRGVALREAAAAPAAPAERMPDLLADPDSLRELVHEIKTPLNAIIGFAEIIEGQYLGPADRGYRERAREIVRQARLLLTAIDDLDFAAKVHTVGGTARERVDLAALVDRVAGELRGIAGERGVELEVTRPRGEVAAAVQPELADRLLFRLLSALAERAESGERLTVSAEQASDGARVSVSRPTVLRGIPDGDLFETPPAPTGAQAGFTLRLVRGLARIAGGDLVSGRETFALVFPRG
jgi:signal transduction histidine kinase